ncbi:hypothetical protein [Lentibacillus cibarius]|uniref:PD-(D/E)XK endonuclease-like domain-containing protein n=1 Tax=Lentibacillus cibarius TaxID=2583219 RepID=A0A5S3R802_9BACI|nr:hypothetical protein [Lentibacillus cibarius]TMN23223.1 hypothetical protein FFL34_14835 [Lentibacillus cibarius]
MQKDLKKKQQTQHINGLFPYQTYTSLASCLDQQIYSDKELHIFGLGSLAAKVKKNFNLIVNTFTDLSYLLFNEYHRAETHIYFQSTLRKLIQEGYFNHQNYLINRLSAIVDTMYTIADIGVEEIPVQLYNGRQKEVMYLVNRLLEESIVKDYNDQKVHLTKENISLKLAGHTRIEKFIFYEVEYLNYGRMNLIHFLHRKGFKIEFRIPYQHQYQRTFGYWKQVYEVVTKQKIWDSNVNEGPTNHKGERFALFNEGIPSKLNERDNVSVFEFESQHSFRTYFQKTDDHIFSINPDEIQTLVSDTFSELYENTIGRFPYHLQYCTYWNGKIYLSYQNLIDLITSEWVSLEDAKGKDGLSLMMDLSDYMSGIETTEDVKERLYRLQELDILNKSFDRENNEDTGRNRMKRYMLNPFRTFSFLHSERYDITIKQLINLVEEFERLCGYLLPSETEIVPVNTYFARWQETFRNRIGYENQVWDQVFVERFPDDWEFSAPELLQLIYLTASNFKTKKTDIHSLPTLWEKMLDGNQNQTLHLTNITQMNFPERHSSTSPSLFFNHSEFKSMIQAVTSSMRNRLLHALWVDYTVEENFPKLGLYQLYNMLANYDGPVKFSWIKNLQEDSLRNIYLEILADLYNDGKIESYTPQDRLTLDKMQKRELVQKPDIDVKQFHNKIPDVYWLNHDFCSKKFFMATFIDQEPIYEQEFHHQFLFSKIGKLFSISQSEREAFQNYIFPLFPHWTFTKKENLIDMEYQVKLRKYKNFENITYPRELQSLQILRSLYRENRRTKARNQYRKYKDFNDKEIIKQFKKNINQFEVKAEPGNHCKMCQFLKICSEGMYAIDNNDN